MGSECQARPIGPAQAPSPACSLPAHLRKGAAERSFLGAGGTSHLMPRARPGTVRHRLGPWLAWSQTRAPAVRQLADDPAIALRRRSAGERCHVASFARVEVEVVAEVHADVGEGPHWDEQSQTLLFVDVSAGAVFRYDPSLGTTSSFRPGGRCRRPPARRRTRARRAGRDRNGFRHRRGLRARGADRARPPGEPDERREVRPRGASLRGDDGL